MAFSEKNGVRLLAALALCAIGLFFTTAALPQMPGNPGSFGENEALELALESPEGREFASKNPAYSSSVERRGPAEVDALAEKQPVIYAGLSGGEVFEVRLEAEGRGLLAIVSESGVEKAFEITNLRLRAG